MPSLPVATNGLVDMEALHSRSCRHFCLSKYPLYRVGWAHRIRGHLQTVFIERAPEHRAHAYILLKMRASDKTLTFVG